MTLPEQIWGFVNYIHSLNSFNEFIYFFSKKSIVTVLDQICLRTEHHWNYVEMKQAERNVAFSGSPVMYSQFSVQHMWRISTHLHTEVMSDQAGDGKTEDTRLPFTIYELKPKQRVNFYLFVILTSCHFCLSSSAIRSRCTLLILWVFLSSWLVPLTSSCLTRYAALLGSTKRQSPLKILHIMDTIEPFGSYHLFPVLPAFFFTILYYPNYFLHCAFLYHIFTLKAQRSYIEQKCKSNFPGNYLLAQKDTVFLNCIIMTVSNRSMIIQTVFLLSAFCRWLLEWVYRPK